MKTNLPIVMPVVALGLCVATVVLFIQNVKLEDQLVDLDRDFEQELRAKARDIDALDRRVEAITERLERKQAQLENVAKKNADRLDTLGNTVQRQTGEIESVRSGSEQLRTNLITLRNDVAKGVQSELTKDVVEAALEMSIKTMMQDETLIQHEAFRKALAKTLVSNHQEELRGVAGTDADNAVVASTLKTDPEFIDMVSVSLLVASEDKTAAESR